MSGGPRWITCEHCGSKRDTSSRYTSPANARRDAEQWKAEHETRACVDGCPLPHDAYPWRHANGGAIPRGFGGAPGDTFAPHERTCQTRDHYERATR